MIVTASSELPDGFDQLRREAAQEGFDHIEALWSQWQDHTNRFTGPGELLVVATIHDDLAGIGGITQDFMDPAWLRMRRFYVRPTHRRRGVGSAIAEHVLDHAIPLGREIALHADTDEARAFWLTHGFVEIDRQNTTHFFRGTLAGADGGL